MVSFSDLKSLYPDNWLCIAKRYKEIQNYTCEECGEKYPANSKWLHVHHKIPLSKGGSSEFYNLQCLCYNCHKKKHLHMGKHGTSDKVKFSKPFE